MTHCLDEDCAHAIIQSGISHVKYGMFTRKSERDKDLDIELAAELLRLGKVTYRSIFCYIGIIKLLSFIQFSKFNTLRYPQVTVTATAGNDIQISLQTRIEKGRHVVSSEPEKDLFLTWEQFFMSLAMLSAKKI